ncbi:sterol desaturase family protein [Microbulbifer thermotolerans]|uniref:sterol desaturase family protein n=1 Tax=Microbulbifer thermotolerans TaxID=252514 RepID=UPI0026712BD7|nr:sterol desaturase family protein [Microbulbifer thermotolerans]WKT60521.1 sterol desaturase family protein [Microbulbifer thermotolerans]
MSLITLAIPFFLIAVLVELALDRWRGWGLYRLNDAIGSLGAGILSRLSGLVRAGLLLAIYVPAYEWLKPIYAAAGLHWSANNIWDLFLAVVAYDFCYYWKHRFAHEINLLWADHLVHHQSEDYNLTTALRQPAGGPPVGWIFYMPLLAIGLPPEMVVTAGAIDLIYQFWVHTQKFPKVRWMEWVFVTPSNHRVHHAQNKIYVDRNYGGVFIIWDRLFGTYQEELEEEPCIYGVRKPLNSFDPLAANLQHYKRMALDAWHTKNWWDKLTLWFRRTGYRPADAEAAMPVPSCDLNNFQRFDPQITRGQRIYALAQHLCYSAATLALLWHAQHLDYWQQLTTVLALTFGLVVNGRILDGHRLAKGAELIRLGALTALLPLLPTPLSATLAIYCLLSALSWWWLAFTSKADRVALVSD